MRIRRIDRKMEKDILIGMITDKEFLGRIRSSIELYFFKNSYCRTVVKWVLDFYDKYGEPPFNEIKKIYQYNQKQGEVDEDEVDLIKDLLEEAAEQYAECPNLNYQFLIEKTEEYFNRVYLERLFCESQEFIEQGKVDEAQQLVLNAKSIKIGEKSASDGLTDEGELQSAFADSDKPLFKLPGDLGRMVNSELCRDRFVVLQAPEKTGKTWWLMMLALRALRSRLKVVMFQLEMTKNQVNKRMSISISGRSDQKKYCTGEHIPCKFSTNANPVPGLPEGVGIEYKDLGEYEPLTWQTALEENQRFYDKFRLKKDQHWRLITAPARSINVKQIDVELDRLEKEEGFVADVVLIDYMDILGPENSKETEERARINSTWVATKALCNKRHIFVGSVTQANASAYNQELQTRSSFSEDHRKYAHTNGTLGLTQTPNDKKFGFAKINWLVLREGDYNERDACYILQCLKRGRFCVDSMTKESFERREGVRLGAIKSENRREERDSEKKPKSEKTRRSTRDHR